MGFMKMPNETQLDLSDPKLSGELWEKSIENIYILFQTWVKEKYGYSAVQGVEQIKLWYKFIAEKRPKCKK